ncbi:hypothetical protein [Mycolicibacterium sp. J2]|uniref:hypothetical protein n=1 Tax=Mycolicibacterium sp. J2 TaxID=2993511 RepID=UPI00224A56EB|nr:hypothetical protein [Mycolicibacterium sp. J2]MCX2715634.1 hypothetical protein [Mycolicibacterium sp. J2]
MSDSRRPSVAVIGQHACGAESCDTAIPAESFLCEDHTRVLPAPLRYAVRDSYTPGQLPSKNRYLSAAVDTIAHKEKRAAPRSGPRKAVQLTLFEM